MSVRWLFFFFFLQETRYTVVLWFLTPCVQLPQFEAAGKNRNHSASFLNREVNGTTNNSETYAFGYDRLTPKKYMGST